MSLVTVLNDIRFNLLFSLLVGIGIICMVRPRCKGDECLVNKPPSEKDFDKYVYRMPGNKCYEFKTELIKCPVSGAIEAFQEENHIDEPFKDSFARRISPIITCE